MTGPFPKWVYVTVVVAVLICLAVAIVGLIRSGEPDGKIPPAEAPSVASAPPAQAASPEPAVVPVAPAPEAPKVVGEDLTDAVLKSVPRADPNGRIVGRILKPGDFADLDFGPDNKTGWVYISRWMDWDLIGDPAIKGLVTKDTSLGTGSVAGEFWMYTRVPGATPQMKSLKLITK